MDGVKGSHVQVNYIAAGGVLGKLLSYIRKGQSNNSNGKPKAISKEEWEQASWIQTHQPEKLKG